MNDKKLVYWEPDILTKDQVIYMLSTDSTADKEKALVCLVHSEIDYEFTKDIIFKYTNDDHEAMRGTAILCIGHIARIHGILPKDETIKIILKGLTDRSLYVRMQSKAAYEDVDIFIPEIGKEIRKKM